jgi:hypothetical protein
MNLIPSSIATQLPTAAVIFTALIAATLPSEAPAQSRPFNIPDLSSYDCATVNAATAAGVRHMGQVIKGRYHEWHEIYADVGGKKQLACISLIVPESRKMSLGEARAFLKDASAVGTPDSSAIQEAPQGFQNSAIKPAPGTGLMKKQAGEIEVPPIPVIKAFKKAGASPGNKSNDTAAAKAAPFSFHAPPS